jgi:phage terminase large subunit-like protein
MYLNSSANQHTNTITNSNANTDMAGGRLEQGNAEAHSRGYGEHRVGEQNQEGELFDSTKASEWDMVSGRNIVADQKEPKLGRVLKQARPRHRRRH